MRLAIEEKMLLSPWTILLLFVYIWNFGFKEDSVFQGVLFCKEQQIYGMIFKTEITETLIV